MTNEKAQQIAEKLRGFEGIDEVLWITVTNRMTEFYIIAASKQAAEVRRNDIQNLANHHDRTRFAVLPRDGFSWGFSGAKQ